MKCPYCNSEDTKVIDSRSADEGVRIRRRRECFSCFQRFTTYETVETMPIMVIKRNRGREPYNRMKLTNGYRRIYP